MTRRRLRVLDPGLLTTVQDRGRTGHAALGVSPSGAADRAAHDLANRLVGNPPDAATLELTLGGLRLRAEAAVDVALTGARCPGAAYLARFRLAAGESITLGTPARGLRSYLAVRGGLAVPPVLGSRSYDLLSGLGPAPVRAGDALEVGDPTGPYPPTDHAPVAEPEEGAARLSLLRGPRSDWLEPGDWAVLGDIPWTVGVHSNRIAVRLESAAPGRLRAPERPLPSEGLVRGAVQLPPAGTPVLFLADHPVTGGYPVIGYLSEPDQHRVAQLRPGQPVRLAAPR